MSDLFSLPGSDLLNLANPFGQNPASGEATQVVKPGNKSGGGGGGSKSSRTLEAAKQKGKEREWDDATAGIGDHNPEPVEDPVENKPKAILKKVGWSENKTLFQTDAEIFADFSVPESEKQRTRVDFQLLIQEKGEFKIIAEAQGHCNAEGHATAQVPIAKPKAGDPSKPSSDSKASAEIKAIFALKAKHCTAEWSKPAGTEREVNETAEEKREHATVSGIHFAEHKSFIAPQYLQVFKNLETKFKDWKKDHPHAKVVVYGHAEKDEDKPRELSIRRAKITWAFLQGDSAVWNQIAEEERWGIWEQQSILHALGFYSGTVDGVDGPKTKQAGKDFINWINEHEGKKLNPLLGFSESHIRQDLYRIYITGSKRSITLPIKEFRLVSGNAFVGCTSFNRYNAAQNPSGENRRATFLLIAESPHFPATFPCRSSSSVTCESEVKKPGERTVKGFSCKFYDEIIQETGGIQIQQPAKQKGETIEVGIFFDGTDNNRDRDRPKGSDTNISKLYDLFDHDDKTRFAFYFEGLGTGNWKTSDHITGGFSGRGIENRIERANLSLKQLVDKYPNSEFRVSVFGFSRGSATALAFINQLFKVNHLPILSANNHQTQSTPFQWPFEKIWFLGIFDAVGSIGMPGDDDESGHEIFTPYPHIRLVTHLVSQDERRQLFPLSSIRTAPNAPLPQGWTEMAFPGVHSDVGGGYENEDEENPMENNTLSQEFAKSQLTFKTHKRDYLSRVAGWAMYDAAKSAGVPMYSVKDVLPDSAEDILQHVVSGNSKPGDTKDMGFVNFAYQGEKKEDLELTLQRMAVHPSHIQIWKNRVNESQLKILIDHHHPDYSKNIAPFSHDSLKGFKDPKALELKVGVSPTPRTIFYRGKVK